MKEKTTASKPRRQRSKAKKVVYHFKGLSAEASNPTSLKIKTNGQTRTMSIPELPTPGIVFHSENHVLNAVYAMAVKELQENTTPEGLLTAGAAWSTVWTRDIAYAADLGLNLAAPQACRQSLESRVRDGIIVQDTGTGGGWPISTDRVSWALGAWACYQVNGDKKWLRYCIDVLKKTFAQDDALKSTNNTILMPGETSFIDWREQSYADWMTTADIGSCYAFGTNILHVIARRLRANMLIEDGRSFEAETYIKNAALIATEIEKLFWDKEKGRYSMTLNPCGVQDQRTDTLATALAVISGIASPHEVQALESLPRSPYGVPVYAPYKSTNSEAYHNRAIWPFVEAYVLRAHAGLKDLAGVESSMQSLIRAALAFGTNKENFHAVTGSDKDTVQNSDRQLWSVAGMLGLFFHGLLGLQLKANCLEIRPCVPKLFAGHHKFKGFRIRKMKLSVHLYGHGSEIESVTINGNPVDSTRISLQTKGSVRVKIHLKPAEKPVEIKTVHTAGEDLATPQWDSPQPKRLSWHAVPGATHYEVYAGNVLEATTRKPALDLKHANRITYREYYVRAVNVHKSSLFSTPYEYIAKGSRLAVQPQSIGENGEHIVENQQAWLDTRPCTSKLLYEPIAVRPGTYRVRVCYSNATASLRDGDTCALRELHLDGKLVGIIPLPHNTEAGRWEDYTLSSFLTIRITDTEEHRLALLYTPACENGNREVNQCMVRHLELTRIS